MGLDVEKYCLGNELKWLCPCVHFICETVRSPMLKWSQHCMVCFVNLPNYNPGNEEETGTAREHRTYCTRRLQMFLVCVLLFFLCLCCRRWNKFDHTPDISAGMLSKCVYFFSLCLQKIQTILFFFYEQNPNIIDNMYILTNSVREK